MSNEDQDDHFFQLKEALVGNDLPAQTISPRSRIYSDTMEPNQG